MDPVLLDTGGLLNKDFSNLAPAGAVLDRVRTDPGEGPDAARRREP
jgi:hypothetical protein